MIYCDEHDPEVCKDCGVTECDNKPKRRGEDEIYSLAEAAITQLNLPKNMAKGGWEQCSTEFLRKKLIEEFVELYEAFEFVQTEPTPENRQRVREEAGDVVNIVMMLADNCGALEAEETVEYTNQKEKEEASK